MAWVIPLYDCVLNAQVAQLPFRCIPTCLAVGQRTTEPGAVLLATATANSEVQLHRAVVSVDDPQDDDAISHIGMSTRLSSYPVSTMTFHPTRPELLVATMDGNIHFLSAATASACTSVETLQLPLMIASAFKAAINIHRPPPPSKCTKSNKCLCLHAASIRAETEEASKMQSRHQPTSSATETAAEGQSMAESIQTVLSLRFVLETQPIASSVTGSNTALNNAAANYSATSSEQKSRYKLKRECSG